MTYQPGDRVRLNSKADLEGPEGSPNAKLRAKPDAVGTVTAVADGYPDHLFVTFDEVDSEDFEALLLGMPGAYAMEAREVDPYTAPTNTVDD